MPARHILVVEDDPSIQRLLATALETEGLSVTLAATGAEALASIQQRPADLVLTDLQLPDMDGVALIERLGQVDPSMTTMIMTGYGTVERAVQAMRAGAVDFIRKPFELKAVTAAVTHALECRSARVCAPSRVSSDTGGGRPHGMVGTSEAMRTVLEFVDKVADSDSTVLILGESGTGKEVLARALHAQSRRGRGPLVPVNCGAIPETLLESELFGHERGAFSGAHQARAGRFEMAQGGTLFLDEIGELPIALQVKLLRAIQERCFERVGGTRSIKVDVRIIAATNQDLDLAVREGRFRKDLFYRLNVIPLIVPPLRERRADIPVLAQYFIPRVNRRAAASVAGVDASAMECLLHYDWPGNVRELENMMERMVVLKRTGTIGVDDLPDVVRAKRVSAEPRVSVPATLSQDGIDLMSELEQYENQLIREALTQANGITSKAARLLRLNRTTLVEKLKRKKLDVKGHVNPSSLAAEGRPCLLDEPSMI